MRPQNDLAGQFWWFYGVGGVLGWLAVGFVWWHTGKIGFAVEVVCRTVAIAGSWAGFALAGFWLASTALMLGLGLIVLPIMTVVWVVERRRDRSP